MAYLQPWMLWALPAVLLPIIIHLLNRLRYKTVHWAAMIFLLKANRAATRRAKIRQYLLLACRCLVILFLIWAMSRPLVGGWIGAAAGGAPELVVILLDRSASMEARGRGAESKRAHGLALLAQAAKQSTGSRFVLIENVLRQPLEIADASSLASLQLAQATDTAADVPAMMRSALEYLVKNKPGSAELWIASDLQSSNWLSDSGEWSDIAARFAGLPQSLNVRVLDLSAPAGANVSVAVKSAEVRVRDPQAGKAQLSLALELKASFTREGTLPLLVTREAARSQVDISMTTAVQRQNLRFDLPRLEPGWGKVELPADEVPTDNVAYFVHAPPVPLHTSVLGEGAAAEVLRAAAAPDTTRADRTAQIFSASQAETIDWKETALVISAGATPTEAGAKALASWIESGGVLLAFPPRGEPSAGPAGLAWAAEEAAQQGAPFRVTAWDELDGPLAKTDSGASLAVGQLEILRRQIPTGGEFAHVFATFADGRPFLVGRKVGTGHVFACASLPDREWSNLGDGFVLVPLVQRLLALGGARLAPPTMAVAGEWQPTDEREIWTAVETNGPRDRRWHAGVYQSGGRRIALNRPANEDVPDIVDRARLPELLRGVKLNIMAGALELKADRLQSEIWPAMLILAMLFMCVEMLLATSKALLPTRAVPKPAGAPPIRRPERRREEVGV